MHFGTAWYPEHWPEPRWKDDIRLMREAEITVCRIGEFAWSSLELTEGEYQFDWLERAVGQLAEAGIAVVLGTPTAAPPAWLTAHHPDTVAVDPAGRPISHGNRCHYSPTSPTYHKYVRHIVEQMARRFGQDPRVIGWQIDNEYSRIDYSDNSRRQFQAFLKEQYGTLEALNSAWSTAYWSQTYSDWKEVPLPVGPHNPGLMLAFRRFVTRVWRDFQRFQIECLRLYIRPEQWVTHNFMGWFDAFDHYTLAEDLDFASWDWYIGTGHHDDARSGAMHDLTRGLKRKNFWVMETQPGCVNWSSVNNMLNRGEGRAMAWHAVAHGADAFLYWQWRSAPGGQEQLHGTLLAADGTPRPFYQEARQIGEELRAASEALEGTTLQNTVAVLHSYESRWSLDAQRHHKELDPVGVLMDWYRPLARQNIGMDVLEPTAPLADNYRLVVAPALVLLNDTITQNLVEYVTAGGCLVLTVRCGQKDRHNALISERAPGPLREIAGVEVEEYFALDERVPIRTLWETERRGEGRIWAERLRPLNAEVTILARFGPSNGWLDDGCAVAMHPFGTRGGSVITVGAILDEALQEDLVAWIVRKAGVAPLVADVPDGVEVARRVAEDGRTVLIVINHTRQERRVSLPVVVKDLFTGEMHFEAFTLPAYGVLVGEAQ